MLRRISHLLLIGLSVCMFAFSCSGQPQPTAPSASDDKQEKEAPKPLTADLGDGETMEFLLIPKGTFIMGSPEDEKGRCLGSRSSEYGEQQHVVEITKPFYLAKYPTTQEQYKAIMGISGLQSTYKGKHLPFDRASWYDAQEFCKKMRDKDKQRRQFRLPTEAEWEYACRAGTKTAYYFGDDPEKLGEYAWFGDLSGTGGQPGNGPHPVGEKKPNAWGLFDMNGNIAQWCEDESGFVFFLGRCFKMRVIRGGYWASDASMCRAAARDGFGAELVSPGINGFRVAFSPE